MKTTNVQPIRPQVLQRTAAAAVTPGASTYLGMAAMVYDSKINIEYVLFANSRADLQKMLDLQPSHITYNADKLYRCAFMQANDLQPQTPFAGWVDPDPQADNPNAAKPAPVAPAIDAMAALDALALEIDDDDLL